MADKRKKDADWIVTGDNGHVLSVQHAQLAVAMDIRDELQKLNNLLHCSNFIAIPRILRRISTNTANMPKVKKKAAG